MPGSTARGCGDELGRTICLPKGPYGSGALFEAIATYVPDHPDLDGALSAGQIVSRVLAAQFPCPLVTTE